MNDSQKVHWLRLCRSENIGKSTFFRLIVVFKTPQNALKNLPDFAASGGLKRKIDICSEEKAEKELKNTEDFGAQILTFSDENYPRLLRDISDPSPILTVKGDINFFNNDTIAIVGPRNASFNAIALAKNVALELGQHSVTTVSGLARGIDGAAHEASILSGTIAVIGGGIDHVYPRENANLFRLVAENGLIVSENPFGASPKGGHFIQRNRIISGLSYGVIIVEAGLRSGSLTTARFAKEQGREIFSVPGSPFDPRCQGANRLIKDGARMFESIDDILEELPALRARFSETGIMREPESDAFKGPEIKMPSDVEIKEVREIIISKLSMTPTPIDTIIREIGAPIRVINIALIQLELTDKIEAKGGMVALKLV